MKQTDLMDIEPTFQPDRIAEIQSLLRQVDQINDEIQVLEATLARKNAQKTNLEQTVIPDLMREIGVTDFTTTDGRKVSLEKFYSARISEENANAAFDWLENTGNASIIKSDVTVSLNKGQQEELERVISLLSENQVLFSRKMSVHASTLKAFVRERIENGQSIPVDLFGVFIGEKVKVK
jgi:hypothetical protein